MTIAHHHRPAEKPLSRHSFLDWPTWCVGSLLTIGLLVVWSNGANNLAVPGVPVPIVDLLFVLLLVRGRRYARGFASTREGRQLKVLLLALSVIVGLRLALDLPTEGLSAARGAIFALEIWAVFWGAAVAARIGREATSKAVERILQLAVVWFMLYPFRSALTSLSPTVGVQRPTALFAFTTIGLVSSWALLWFGLKRGLGGALFAIAALVALLFGQVRSTFAAIPLALVLMAIASGKVSRRVVRRVLLAAISGLLLLSVLPPIGGRLASVSVSGVGDLVRTGLGQSGEASSSYQDRQRWIDATFEAVSNEPAGWLVGVGFGTDLTGGFTANGVSVVHPHNDFLEYWARLGFGVLPWALSWYVVMRAFFRRARHGDPLALWAVGASVCTLLFALTQPLSAFAYGGMVWWFICGLVLGVDRTCRQAADPTDVGTDAAGVDLRRWQP